MKLNIGCGRYHKKGYVNCDISEDVNADKVVDLEKKLPFEDNSVDEIIAFHILEHVNNLIPLMGEFQRVCKNGAKIFIKVPYYTIPAAYGNPTHVRFFTFGSWDYFSCPEFRSYPKAKFKIIERKLISSTRNNLFSRIIDSLVNKSPKKYERFFSGIFPMQEIRVQLEVKK